MRFLKDIGWGLIRLVYWVADLPERMRRRNDRPPWEEW
jgi:hypothetical protein